MLPRFVLPLILLILFVHSAHSASVLPHAYIDPKMKMEFVYALGGCFQMGTFEEVKDKSVHEVCVDDFFIGKFEVTQGQWQKIMGSNPSSFKHGGNYPVENVSWADVQAFVRKLNVLTGKNYRLPSEAEWEYAARSGGKNEKYSGGNNIDAIAWYDKNSGGSTHLVGQKQPNGLGLFDMSGNVWEWCSDWYDEDYYAKSPRDNPMGPASGSYRVARGGDWSCAAGCARSSLRNGYSLSDHFDLLGFRLVLSGSATSFL